MKKLIFIATAFLISVPTAFADPNLVSWWKFDEGTGSTAYDSAGDNNGVVYGATWTTGQISGALDFDGSDDYVSVPDNNSLDMDNQMTITAWVRLNANSGISTVVGKQPSGTASMGASGNYAFMIYSDTLILSHQTSTDRTEVLYESIPHSVAAEVWQHVAVTLKEGDSVNFYINGFPAGTSPQNQSFGIINNEPLRIGKTKGDVDWFDGAIDDVRIYNRALSEEEIRQMHRQGHGPVAYAPNPYDGETAVNPNIVLSWLPGWGIELHDVYLGTDYNDINDANISSPEYKGIFDINTFDPCGLTYQTAYYWRVDEINDTNTWKGNVWSFHTTDADGILHVPSEYPTIQKAIDMAANSEVVIIAPGTYTGNGNRDIDFKGKAITLRSIDPNDPCVVAATVINAQGTINEPHRGLYIDTVGDVNSAVIGLKIINGFTADDGGGIYCYRTSPLISRCIISMNTAYDDSYFYCYGGGIYCYQSSPTIERCIISQNQGEMGAGISVYWYCYPLIEDCLFLYNKVIGNYDAGGGGLLSYTHCSPIVRNCLFIKNSVANMNWTNGGGIYAHYPAITIKNCTFAGNSARRGGAFYASDCNAVISNSIFWDNFVQDDGPQIYIQSVPQIMNVSKISYCDIDGDTDQIRVVLNDGDILEIGPGIINIDPCFVDADANDYHLKSEGWYWDTTRRRWDYDDVTSRCIDAGNPGSPLANEPVSVPPDPNNVWGQNLRINMGAFGGTAEASMPPYDWAILADLTNDGTVDLIDFAYQAADWLNSAAEQPGDFNRDGLIDTSDLALLADDWLKQTSWH